VIPPAPILDLDAPSSASAPAPTSASSAKSVSREVIRRTAPSSRIFAPIPSLAAVANDNHLSAPTDLASLVTPFVALYQQRNPAVMKRLFNSEPVRMLQEQGALRGPWAGIERARGLSSRQKQSRTARTAKGGRGGAFTWGSPLDDVAYMREAVQYKQHLARVRDEQAWLRARGTPGNVEEVRPANMMAKLLPQSRAEAQAQGRQFITQPEPQLKKQQQQQQQQQQQPAPSQRQQQQRRAPASTSTSAKPRKQQQQQQPRQHPSVPASRPSAEMRSRVRLATSARLRAEAHLASAVAQLQQACDRVTAAAAQLSSQVPQQQQQRRGAAHDTHLRADAQPFVPYLFRRILAGAAEPQQQHQQQQQQGRTRARPRPASSAAQASPASPPRSSVSVDAPGGWAYQGRGLVKDVSVNRYQAPEQFAQRQQLSGRPQPPQHEHHPDRAGRDFALPSRSELAMLRDSMGCMREQMQLFMERRLNRDVVYLHRLKHHDLKPEAKRTEPTEQQAKQQPEPEHVLHDMDEPIQSVGQFQPGKSKASSAHVPSKRRTHAVEGVDEEKTEIRGF
jgi:hypothetical protein